MTVLALDIAKWRTGYAIGSPWPGSRFQWGTFETSEFDARPGYWLSRWRKRLVELLTGQQVTYIAVESFFIDMRDFNFNGSVPMAMMHGVLREVAEDLSVVIGEASSRSWRKFVFGSAKLPDDIVKKARSETWKKKAIAEAVSRGWYVTHHDEAEALLLLDFTLAAKDADYRHRTGQLRRRAQLNAERTGCL